MVCPLLDTRTISYSTTATLSTTCDNPTAAGNATLVLSQSGSASPLTEFLDGASLPVATLATSASIAVVVAAAPEVTLTGANNATSSVVGLQWSVTVDSDANTVSISGAMSSKAIGTLTLVQASTLTVAMNVTATGRCLPPGHNEQVVFSWLLTPVPPETALRTATAATFRASSVASSAFGHPMSAMSITAVISLLALDECLYSDVDPLDPSVSPLGVAVGAELGQYYRGGAAVALGLYGGIVGVALAAALVISRKRSKPLTAAMAPLHFPSVGMVVVGLFGQGLASCGMSLIRLDSSAGDVALGVFSLLICAALVVLAVYATTCGLDCEIAPLANDPVTEVPAVLQPMFRLATWRQHWRDTSGPAQFKRRHMMLIDDLRLPWWTSVELSSCLVQGAVLGIRVNSLATCQAQQWFLTVHCGLVALAAAWLRPCGAVFSNMFLVLSKLSSFIIGLFVLLHALTLDDVFSSYAEMATAISTAIGTCQTALQLVMMLLPRLTSLGRLILRLLTGSNAIVDGMSHVQSAAQLTALFSQSGGRDDEGATSPLALAPSCDVDDTTRSQTDRDVEKIEEVARPSSTARQDREISAHYRRVDMLVGTLHDGRIGQHVQMTRKRQLQNLRLIVAMATRTNRTEDKCVSPGHVLDLSDI